MDIDITLHKSSICGCRPSNEDVEKYTLNLSSSGAPLKPHLAPVDFFVICDGHGGIEVAKYCAPRLEAEIMKKGNVFPIPFKMVNRIYNQIQHELINHHQRIARHCGCTAVVVIRYLDQNMNKNIQVINVGDSRAVLSRRGLAIPLCKDHKPSWPDEQQRIINVNSKCAENAKKPVHYNAGDWRVGDLSVSRAFGDLDNTPQVTHVPEAFTYQLLPSDEFIIMACDGVWDVMENHHAVNFVRDNILNRNLQCYDIPGKYPPAAVNSPTNIARRLAVYAIAKGSKDNVSVIIIQL